MVNRSEDRTAPYPYTSRKRKLDEASTSHRFPITPTRHAVVETFNGEVYMKIRRYIQRKDADLWSSPRGVNLRVEEWKTLVKMIPTINNAVKQVEVSFMIQSISLIKVRQYVFCKS